MSSKKEQLKAIHDAIKIYSNFPIKGVFFRDIFPILRNPILLKNCVKILSDEIKANFPQIQALIGLESRGFLFAPMIAQQLGIGFIPIRKKGKLPGELISINYTLEYGVDTIEISKDSLKGLNNVVIFDDLLATGGTMKAAENLIKLCNIQLLGCVVLIELMSLDGKKHLESPVLSLFKLDESEIK